MLPHRRSVRGFFAGTNRKKLGMALVSEKIGDQRVYCVLGGKSAKSRSAPNDLAPSAQLAMGRPNTIAIERELDRIRTLGGAELRLEWQRLNHDAPPKLSRHLLALALDFRLTTDCKRYSFTAPPVRPAVMRRWPISRRSIGGIEARTAVAIIAFQSV